MTLSKYVFALIEINVCMNQDISVKNYPANPFEFFKEWFEEASQSKSIEDANALNLGTCSKSGRPSTRVVLLKKYDSNGMVFFTNGNSHKGRDLLENPFAEMCFYWPQLGKQIRIYGAIHQVSTEESNKYFLSRNIESQIASSLSNQSSVLESYSKLKDQFLSRPRTPLERPSHWYGLRLVPKEFEFWLDGEHRLHLRHKFIKTNNHWNHQFLYP